MRRYLVKRSGYSFDFSFEAMERRTFLSASPVVNSVTPTLVPSTTQVLDNWQFAIDGTNLGTHAAFKGNNPDFILTDVTRKWSAGNPGDGVGVNLTSWTGAQIDIAGFTSYGGNFIAVPGDQMSVTLTNPANGLTSAAFAFKLPVVTAPKITGVTAVSVPLSSGNDNWIYTITGANLGSQPAFRGKGWTLAIKDLTADWTAGASEDAVGLTVTSWTSSKIVVDGYTPYPAPNSVAASGDEIAISLSNPNTAAASNPFDVKLTAASLKIAAPANQTAIAGASKPFTLGSFTQSSTAAPYTVIVNWGDGSAATKFTLAAAGTIPAQSHAFARIGTDVVSISIEDAEGNVSRRAIFDVQIAPAPVLNVSIDDPATSPIGEFFDLSPLLGVVSASSIFAGA